MFSPSPALLHAINGIVKSRSTVQVQRVYLFLTHSVLFAHIFYKPNGSVYKLPSLHIAAALPQMILSSLASCPCPPPPHSLQVRGIHGDQEMRKGKEQAATKAAAGKAQQCSAERCPHATADTTVLSLHL